MTTKYEVLADREIHDTMYARKGNIVYGCTRYDYGVASDDTRALGIKHISVTLKEDGDYPFFTIPLRDLKLL